MNRKLIAMATAIMLALSMTACGGSESSSTTEEEALKKEIQEELDGEKKADEAEADSAGPIEYAPTQEILDADFSSGLVQVGNDVFKCGGYLTVGDFLEQYGDRYEAVKRESIDDEFELRTDFDTKISDLPQSDEYTVYNSILFRSKKDNKFFVSAYYVEAGTHKYDSNATLRDAVIYNFEGKKQINNSTFEDVTFFPSGIKSDLSDTASDSESIKELFNAKVKTTETKEVGDYKIKKTGKPDTYSLGVLECDNGVLSIASAENVENESVLDYYYATNIILKDDNLFGYKPVVCFLVKDYNVGKNIKGYYYQFELEDGVMTRKVKK